MFKQKRGREQQLQEFYIMFKQEGERSGSPGGGDSYCLNKWGEAALELFKHHT